MKLNKGENILDAELSLMAAEIGLDNMGVSSPAYTQLPLSISVTATNYGNVAGERKVSLAIDGMIEPLSFGPLVVDVAPWPSGTSWRCLMVNCTITNPGPISCDAVMVLKLLAEFYYPNYGKMMKEMQLAKTTLHIPAGGSADFIHDGCGEQGYLLERDTKWWLWLENQIGERSETHFFTT
jgi:hypothetical protein